MTINEVLLFIKRNQIRIREDLKNNIQPAMNLVSLYNVYWKSKDNCCIALLTAYCKEYKKYITRNE